MKKILITAVILTICVLSIKAQDYRNSLGFNVGSLNGLSYKGFVFRNPNVALQVDLGVNVYKTAGLAKENIKWEGSKYNGNYAKSSASFSKMTAMSFTINPNFLYQKQLKTWEKGSFCWFIGGGVSLGLMKSLSEAYIKKVKYEEHADGETYSGSETVNEYGSFYLYDDVKHPIYGKVGLNAMTGFELFLNPLVALSCDFRPGYGLGWYSCLSDYDRHDALILHHFDWSLSIGLRFVLDKPF